ncbi:HEAT repeat domain-containing protein [Tolypothrix sp. FACHB-123]|uniref:HEAT repeat domain-containing protein n=1 Tax=Tolypothrix sp. FACHB-123 TaxID=2692868 RepID=UPI0027D2607E|nr:HEAT repeat domain-containing protein [Tolypothrix sp. FACHB-123]
MGKRKTAEKYPMPNAPCPMPHARTIFLFLFTCLLTIIFSLTWVNAEEEPKPKPEQWQIQGIMAALDDDYPQVKKLALDKLGEYELQNLKSLEKELGDTAKIAATILKDKSVEADVRSSAAYALGNLGSAATPYIKDILDFLKDNSVDANVRYYAAQALGKLGSAATPYIKDILDFLKDKSVESSVRSSAAQALGNLGSAATPHIKDILDFLKDKSVEANVRYYAAYALRNLGSAATPYIKDILDFLKDKSVESSVRSSAAQALGKLGSAATPYIKDILNLLKDKSVEADVRYYAADALGKLGSAATPYIKDILDLLKDKSVESSVRSSAADALGKLGSTATPYIQDIADFLKDKSVDASFRSSAAQALGNLGSAATPYIKDILDFLKDKSVAVDVRSSAADALRNLGSAATPYIKDILDFLKDNSVESSVRSSAAQALGNLSSAATPYIQDIADFLKDKSVESSVRSSAAEALGKLGSAATPYIQDILDFLKDKSVAADVRYRAADALGKTRKLELNEIVIILDNVYYDGQSYIGQWRFLTYFLGGGSDNVNTLLKWLGEPKEIGKEPTYSESQATLKLFLQTWQDSQGLGRLPADLAKKIAIITQTTSWRWHDIDLLKSHYHNLKDAGLTEADTLKSKINDLQYWKWFFLARKIILIHLAIWLTLILAYPKFTQILAPLFWNSWARRILGFGYIGLLLTSVPRLRQRLLQPFTPVLLADAGLDNFVEQTYFGESFVKVPRRSIPSSTLPRKRRVNASVEGLQTLSDPPKSPLKRGTLNSVASFVRNAISLPPWFRNLTLVPPFIRNLTPIPPWFRNLTPIPPFIRNLTPIPPWFRNLTPIPPFLRGARGDQMIATPLESTLTPEIQPITQAIPTLQGQIVLEGESGLGKSMFLRHLANNSQRIFVYLPAQKCDKGVLEAIYAKLRGQINDTNFLKTLIYNGALDICIDGLNEVTADTRAKVSQFAESYFRGNMIMTTQPIEWIPPSTAKKYELQPLQREQIQQFLLSRQLLSQVGCVTPQANAPSNTHPPSQHSGALGLSSITHPTQITQTEYTQACTNYLAEAFNEQQSPEDLAAAKRILSNPMDLTLVALMLSQGQQPNLFRLQEQQYNLMAAEYQREQHHEFPLKTFSQAVYQMRLNDQTMIPAAKFLDELTSLEDEKYKMVISRQWENDKGEAQKSWQFRHDKIMEFFLVQNFLGADAEIQARVNQHINDPRFRGVYLLLTNLLPLDAAVALRETIIEYAANSKDHTLSDKFIQLLQLRLPAQWTQSRSLKQLLQQHEQRTQYLDLVAQFLAQVDAQVNREQEYLIVESSESIFSNYAPFPVLITVNSATDKDIERLVKLAQELPNTQTQKAALLIYKLPPDTTARMEIAKVRLRDSFLLIPIPLTAVEKALSDKYECIGLLNEYLDRYLQQADFFDDKNAITDTLSFFGRTELLQRLGEELLRYQGVGLFGLRKSGKTSVLLQLGFMLREHPRVHIDLQAYSGSCYGAALFNKIIQELSSLESEITLPQFPPLATDKPAAELSSEFIHRFNELTKAIQNSQQYKLPILCFLDEVERIIPTPTDSREKAEEFNAVFGALRVLCQQKRQMSLLIADVHPDCNRINYWSQPGVATNPAFNFFKEIFLQPFSVAETADMLVNLGKLMGLEFDAETPQQIHNQSGGHPFVSRQLARFLTEKIKANSKAAQNGNLFITWAMVAPYLEKTFTQRGELKNYLEKSIWEDLAKRDFQVAMSILRLIACNEQLHDKIPQTAVFNHLKAQFTPNQCLDACNWLVNVGLLYQEEVAHQDFYQIRIPLLSRWIQLQMTDEEKEKCQILEENAPLTTTVSPLQTPPTSGDVAT